MLDRVILAGAACGLLFSLGLHVALLAGLAGPPASPWSWVVHAGTVAGFWCAGARIAARGSRGVAGLLRIRRMVPIPVRLVLGAATVNALVQATVAARGAGVPGAAVTAYWLMSYLLLAILFTFVAVRAPGGRGEVSSVCGPAGRLL